MVCGVIVAALEVIEAGFVIVVVATVTEGVQVGEGVTGGLLIDKVVAAAVGDAGQLAPGVVGISGVGLFRIACDVAVRVLDRHRTEDFSQLVYQVATRTYTDFVGQIIKCFTLK